MGYDCIICMNTPWVHGGKLGYLLSLHPITGVCVYIHHQMEAQTEEQAAEAQKERKLRERNEQYSRQLEEELEVLKVSLQTSKIHRLSLQKFPDQTRCVY